MVQTHDSLAPDRPLTLVELAREIGSYPVAMTRFIQAGLIERPIQQPGRRATIPPEECARVIRAAHASRATGVPMSLVLARNPRMTEEGLVFAPLAESA